MIAVFHDVHKGFTIVYLLLLGAVHILRNLGWGGGLPDLLQYYIGGVLKVYYNITVLNGKWKVTFLLN